MAHGPPEEGHRLRPAAGEPKAATILVEAEE